MIAILSFVILLSYILYAGVAESLSATYYKVKKPYGLSTYPIKKVRIKGIG